MPWKKGQRIPTNLIVGFLGSGKTTAITKLVDQRDPAEHWSILINEFGTVSIDHALVDSNANGVAVEELGGGCACCTLAFAFKPLLARFLRRTKPDRFVLEPSGLSHPAKVVDILRSPDFAGVIDLKNIICLVDPQSFDDDRWKDNEVFQDQIQLADIVVLNWTDCRDRDQIDRCRAWIEAFDPPKQLIFESSFGAIDSELLDKSFPTLRSPLFQDAHPSPPSDVYRDDESLESLATGEDNRDRHPVDQPKPGIPLRFENKNSEFQACGWIFHLEEIFDRDALLDFLGMFQPMLRLKGIFRCEGDWWSINRAKDGIRFSASTYRRDSRLELIVDKSATVDWQAVENRLLACLVR